MHGHQEHSNIPRFVATFGHLAPLAAGSLLLWQGNGDPSRRALVFAMGAVYAARIVFGMFVLLQRRFGWSEALPVLSLFTAFQLGFAYLVADDGSPLGLPDAIAAALYAVGSYFNTGSEYSRHVWKKDKRNKGKLYTEGLFRHAMHINYFGDMLLFAGFAWVTRSPWAFSVPAVMTLGFVFQHVPTLDRYLAERYGEQFAVYASNTKKLIPYVY